VLRPGASAARRRPGGSSVTRPSEFTCTVDIQVAPALSLGSSLIGAWRSVRRHIDEEVPGFAADINRKLTARVG
jgi:hypothetical protein